MELDPSKEFDYLPRDQSVSCPAEPEALGATGLDGRETPAGPGLLGRWPAGA